MFILKFQYIQEFGMIQVEACISISEPHAERKIIPEEPGQSRGDIDQGQVSVDLVDQSGQDNPLRGLFSSRLPVIEPARQTGSDRALGDINGSGIPEPPVHGAEARCAEHGAY